MNAANRGSMTHRKKTLRATVGALVVLTAATGCNVTNPGPVQDTFLDLPQSQDALVSGAGKKLVEAVNDLSYTAALVSREIFPGGQTGSLGHDVLVQAGYLAPGGFNGHWNNAQQARFIAEDAIRRFTEVETDVPGETLAQAYIWAGYAYRVLGENWCQAVIDGSAIQPGSVYFQNAEERFTSALGVAGATATQINAAYAGRAQVRLWLGDFAGAAADAAKVPADFAYKLNFQYDGDTSTRMQLFWANANQPYRAYTIRFTYFDQYYTDTGDPRTPWSSDPAVPVANASLSGFPGGQVPWTFQTKYKTYNDDINLATGREMKLIEAEAMLQQNSGDWPAALDLINQVRTSVISDKTGQPLQPWTANSAEETWTALKQERAIELWLEDRRFGDLRRWGNVPDPNDPRMWTSAVTPGDPGIPNFEAQSPLFSDTPRSPCFDIPDSERNTNPNVPPANG